MFKHRSIVTAIALNIGSPLASADLTTGLVAHYPFNGNANDASGNGNNGTVNGATLTADRFGNANSAYSFDGVNDYVETLYNQTNLVSYTISAWTYLVDDNEGGVIFQNRGPAYQGGTSITLMTKSDLPSSGNITPTRLVAESDYKICGIQTDLNINDSKWHHIVGTWSATSGTIVNENQFNLFIDGYNITTSNVYGMGTITSPINGIGAALIGYHEAWKKYFKGTIDDIRIYNRALSAAEVTELYQENTTHQLTITKTGSGDGTVISTPAGINCGADCSENYASGTSVTLTVTPTAGSIFSGFSGDADCVDKQVIMNAAKNCIATFNVPPTATTGAAANVTQTSATLNGSVTSAGATATATFDLGTTTTYGTNVAATPAQVYSSSAVAVSANKTGLTCGTTYHFRTKAANSIGTSYGTDKAFTTAACNAWLYPVTMNLPRDREFNLNVTAKSDGMYITNYEFVITYDPTKLSLIYNPLCNNYVCPGANALNTNSVYLVGTNAVKIIGLGGQTAANNDLQLLIIKFKTQTTLGITNVELKTNSLVNTSGMNIGLEARGAAINISSGICGDADGNNVVNIVDALAVARKVVGLPPPPTIEPLWADVNKDNNVTIIDALMIARYSVGLVLPPEVCNIGMAL